MANVLYQYNVDRFIGVEFTVDAESRAKILTSPLVKFQTPR